MEIKEAVEVLIFASDGPISLYEISQIIGVEANDLGIIEKVVAELNKSYQETGRTFSIRKVAGGYQFATNKQYHSLIEMLYKDQKKVYLSTLTMEVLAIIAYHQPITRAKIDAIRGVNSQYHIHNLLEVKLIKIKGRLKTLGRPILYGTTEKFLQFFGLNDIQDLPNLHQIKELTGSDVSQPQKITKSIDY
jgi:segregation and condensation protein B